jgi:Domain of unknown function (DUF6265)
MKLRLPALILLVAATISLFAQFPSSADIEKLRWMSGSWITTQGGTTIEEHWTQPAAGTMLGMGRTVAGNKTAFFEYLRIETRGADLVYVAHPKARPGTDFKASRVTEDEVVFENPQHDFPKRIIYKRTPAGNITARVEGDPGDKEKAETYEYKRMKN